MKMKFEKYFRPTTVQEAIDLMKEYGTDCKVIAGGTDVVIRLRARTLRVQAIIDISAIPELKGITLSKDKAVIGAAHDLRSLSLDPALLESEWEIVAECAGHVSSTQIRNLATLGGNNVNASPSADTTPALLISDAVVNVVGPNGARDIPIDEFFVGPGKTVLEQGELITSFTLPKQEGAAAYHKHAIRGDTDISIVGVGVRIALDENGVVTMARVALGGVAPRSIRVKNVEELLVGTKLTDEDIEKAAELARDSITPITDQRATAEYRKEMVYVNVKNMIREAVAKIG
ncbi:MAG: xanthine dehydrogenase family protein subunit M [Clostridiales bacterium]|nr:xanthine dehydrogenase family protein subunit M [Clostridiales bacterium]